MSRLLVFAVVLLMGVAAHAGEDGSTDHANACISRHHVETTLGVAYNHGKDARSVGVEDEYRFKRTFGAGAFLDTTFRGFDLEAAGLGQERKLGARETPRWVSFPKQQARSLQISRNEWACAS